MIKIITDPKTGMMKTEDDWTKEVTKESLEELRREVKDMVAGNTQFHTDPEIGMPLDINLPL